MLASNKLPSRKPSSKKAKIYIAALIVAALTLTATTYAALSASHSINSIGNVQTQLSSSNLIGVYSDSSGSSSLTSVNWGNISPGTSTTQTIYIKNTGTSSMQLSLATSNWSPAGANNYLAITWNQQGVVLLPGSTISAILTLTVSSTITGITSFSNNIIITGTGT